MPVCSAEWISTTEEKQPSSCFRLVSKQIKATQRMLKLHSKALFAHAMNSSHRIANDQADEQSPDAEGRRNRDVERFAVDS